jgi:hypothetical protein
LVLHFLVYRTQQNFDPFLGRLGSYTELKRLLAWLSEHFFLVFEIKENAGGSEFEYV